MTFLFWSRKVNNLKKLSFFIIFLWCIAQGFAFAIHYHFNLPLEGNSIANNQLQFKVANKIYSLLSEKYPLCNDFAIADTQILHYPYDVKTKSGKYTDGYWKELWTCNVCENKIQIPITFYIKKSKTIFVLENEKDLKNKFD